MANSADVDMGFLPFEFPTRRADCEGPVVVVARGSHWYKVENGGGIYEGR